MSNAHANTSPHFVAQIAKGERLVADQFESWGLTDAHQRAEHLVRRLRTELGWGPPRSPADEPAPPPRPPNATTDGPGYAAWCEARDALAARKASR